MIETSILERIIEAGRSIRVRSRRFGFPVPEHSLFSELNDPARAYGICDRASQLFIVEINQLFPDASFTMSEVRAINDFGSVHSAVGIHSASSTIVVDWTIHQFAHGLWSSQQVDHPHPWVASEDEWRVEVVPRLDQWQYELALKIGGGEAAVIDELLHADLSLEAQTSLRNLLA